MVADQLRSRRKTATIRLGDKSRKYKKGMVVQVLVGARYGPRDKIFDAVIDKVEVKPLAQLSPKEIEHDNPEARRPEELATFLGQLYNREIGQDELVTLIRFSEIRRSVRRFSGRACGSDRRTPPRGRSSAPHASHSTAKTELKRASHDGQRERISPRALRTRRGQLALGLVEVALREAARDAERDPVAEGLASLLPQPVGGFAHETTLAEGLGEAGSSTTGRRYLPR